MARSTSSRLGCEGEGGFCGTPRVNGSQRDRAKRNATGRPALPSDYNPVVSGIERRLGVSAHVALLAACGAAMALGCRSAPANDHARSPARSNEGLVASNVAREDYAGSAACRPCHEDVFAAWAPSPMHHMTRDAKTADVRGPFDGTPWRFHDDVAVLEKRGDDRFVRVMSGGATHEYRVTRVIGGRTREDFAGIDVAGSSEEVVLPVSFVFATGALRYKGYSVMVHERATLRAGPVWSRACIFCHNTIPEADRLLGALAGPRAPAYQGEQVDLWLPEARRTQYRVIDGSAFAATIDAELARLGGAPASDGRGLARHAIDVVRSGFDGSDLVEPGIGCEACHGGSREHVRAPGVRPAWGPRAPWLGASSEAPSHAMDVNRVCARCHQVLFTRYPYTWEGGRRDTGAGGSHISSGEARDFLLGGCADAMACTACHDPHGADRPETLEALATPAGNATCTGCHRELAATERLRAHAHHDPNGAGGACVACHMPRKNMGLDGTLTRYHRIGSPTDPARVLGDRPLECALCHADKSVAALVTAMEGWWPVRYPRQRMEELYGSLDANPLRATVERGKAHEQAVAMAALAEAGARDAGPLIARQLGNEYPLVRQWAERSLHMLGIAGTPASAPVAPVAPESGEEPED
jgi:predicted CXXCH cytochrome family protein